MAVSNEVKVSLNKNETQTDWIEINRQSNETKIYLKLRIDGDQQVKVETGIGFFDHMLSQLAVHAGWDLAIDLSGDLQVDDHHTVEDVAICLGEALYQAWQQSQPSQRYGQRLLPMDETLVLCALDLSGRGFYVGELDFTCEKIGKLATEMVEHFFITLANKAAMSLHIKPIYFRNNHHLAEACFKALAYALRDALHPTTGLNTTKGILS